MSRYISRSQSPVFLSRSEGRFIRPLSNLLKPSSRYAQLRKSLENEQKFEVSKLSFGSNSSSKSLNLPEKLPVLKNAASKRETERQRKENHRLMERILDTKPHVSNRSLDNQWRKNAAYMSLASKYAPEKLRSKSKQDTSKKESKEDLRGSIYEEKKSFSVLQNQKSYKENFHDKNKKYSYGFGAKQKLERTILTDETNNSSTNKLTSLKDIINYIEQNESEGEFEVYVKDDYQNDQQIPISIVSNQTNRIGILKTPDKVIRPISKVSFNQEPFIVYNKNPIKKRYVLPDTNELVYDHIVTPAPTFTEEVEYEIIYAHPNRNIRTRDSDLRSRIDQDRINYLYDDTRNNGNIRVIYNDDHNRKLIRLNNNIPVIVSMKDHNSRYRIRNRKYL